VRKSHEILKTHSSGNTEYDQLIMFLDLHMGDDLLPLLAKAEREGKKISYDSSKLPEGIFDGFDERHVSIV